VILLLCKRIKKQVDDELRAVYDELNTKNVYDELNTDGNDERSRMVLASFLRRAVTLRNRYPEIERDIAYTIAGLLSTTFAMSLKDDDPCEMILSVAGELELPPAHQGNVTWAELIAMVEALGD
jgi:hypothetical protein